MKKNLILLISFCLFGCGFQPIFTGDDTEIYVYPISGINGIDLRNALWAKFGGQYSADSKYVLTVNLNEPVNNYKALEQTGDASWQEVALTASYTLSYNGNVIAKGIERASESYTFVRYLVASNASYNNAVQNTIQVLAEKIGTRAIVETHKHSNNTSGDK